VEKKHKTILLNSGTFDPKAEMDPVVTLATLCDVSQIGWVLFVLQHPN